MKHRLLRIAAATAVLALLCAVLFLAVMGEHDCAGDDDCMICHALGGCRTLLQSGLPACCLLFALPARQLLCALGRRLPAAVCFRTLVQLKTKLSD